MKIAITGAGGQLGSFLARSLGALTGAEIVAVIRNSMGAPSIDASACEIRIGSVTSPDSARHLIGDCEMVVNCALAGGLPRAARAENEAMIESFTAIESVRDIVYLSSVAIYGGCINSAHTSFEKPRPDSAYGFLKRDGERHARARLAAGGRRSWILRLGHVYGPNTAMSKTILSWASDENFGLPFGGRRLSNAIRIDRFGDAIASIARGDVEPGTWNLADDPHLSWRAVADWHFKAIGVPAASNLPEHTSLRFESRVAGRGASSLAGLGCSVAREASGWLRTLPGRFLSEVPTAREFVRLALSGLPEWAETRSKKIYNRTLMGGVDRALFEGRWTAVDPWFLSEGMPGRYIKIPPVSEFPRDESFQKELAAWHRLWARPDGFLDLISPS